MEKNSNRKRTNKWLSVAEIHESVFHNEFQKLQLYLYLFFSGLILVGFNFVFNWKVLTYKAFQSGHTEWQDWNVSISSSVHFIVRILFQMYGLKRCMVGGLVSSMKELKARAKDAELTRVCG